MQKKYIYKQCDNNLSQFPAGISMNNITQQQVKLNWRPRQGNERKTTARHTVKPGVFFAKIARANFKCYRPFDGQWSSQRWFQQEIATQQP